MKTKRIYLGLLLLSAVLFAGCSEESIGPGGGDGEEQNVQLRIETYDNPIIDSRADPTKELQGKEGDIKDNLVNIYVYNDKGTLEYKQENVKLEDNKPVSFKLTTGDKYFYVFANTIASEAFGSRTTRSEFERQVIGVDFDAQDLPNLASEYFFMGTLWAKAETIEKKVHPEVNSITAQIGRLSAKVKLWKVNGENKAYSNMKGKFVDPHYSIGSVPKSTFLVGQLETPSGRQPVYPPATNHDIVESAVHNVPHIDPPGSETQHPDYYNYTLFKEVDPDINQTELTNFFYIVENTTAYNDQGYQYYGNTTYIRLRTKYEPDQTEIFSPDLSQAGNETLTDGTFWTCMYNNRKYITNGEPTHPQATNPIEYKEGINYHFFPIWDDRQEDDLARYSVVRNHYYEVEVTGIRDLGVGESIEKPIIPIPKTFEVEVAVQVVDWSKITQSTPI